MEKTALEKRTREAESVSDIVSLVRGLGKENPNFKKDEEFARKIIPNAGVWYGVKMPSLHLIAKSLARENRDWSKELYAQGSHECRMISSLLLYYSKAGPEKLPLIKEMLSKATNWAIADSIAIFPLGRILVKNPESVGEMKVWRSDPRTWIRRCSVTSLLALIKKGGFLKESLSMCEPLMKDEDPDVQKGVSWILNEVSKRDQSLAYEFDKKWAKKSGANTKKIIRRGIEKLKKRDEIRELLK